MTFIKELNEAARKEHRYDVATRLRWLATGINGALAALHADPTTENMQVLNGLWAKGAAELKIAQEPSPQPPLSGPTVATEFTQELRRAA